MTVEQRDEGMRDHQPVKFCYLDRKEVQYVLDCCPQAGNDGKLSRPSVRMVLVMLQVHLVVDGIPNREQTKDDPNSRCC